MKLHTKLCALCLLGLSVVQAQAQDSDMLTQSRAVTQSMLKELGQKLQSSMAEGGPINAIGVCHLQAPDIATRASTNNQAKISRVGTRARNPVMGVPNDWQAKALAQFDAALARGDKPKVRIEGDVQLAAEINWLIDHVRWDAEEDLARLIGDAPAHTLAQVARQAMTALRSFVAQRPGTGLRTGSAA